MTNQTNLGLVWADTGGVTAVSGAKYVGGWVAEIPTYQNFNYMVQGLDKNILHFAESDSFVWDTTISYQAGARVVSPLGLVFTARTATLGQDPDTDPGNSIWVHGTLIGSNYANLLNSDGLRVELVLRANALYTGVDQTIVNRNPMLRLSTTTATDNLAIGNVDGEAVVHNLGQVSPDSRSLALGSANTSRLFHEGHQPLVTEVPGATEEAPTDGKLYARLGLTATSGNWVVVTSTTVQSAPPPPTLGSGRGWYNLDDGRFYIDINDGDSSQWVPATPPFVPYYTSEDVEYNPSSSTLVSTDVKAALDEIAARLDAGGI